LYVPEALAGGAALAVEAHYLRDVLRLPLGAAVALFNGRDGEWLAEVAAYERRTARLQVTQRLRAQSAGADLWLLFAPLKKARIDWLVEKATELGVGVLWPLFTERTIATRVADARLAAIAREAAEQSGRLTLPEFRPAKPVWQALAAWPADRRLLLCDESGAGAPILEAATAQRGAALALLVGPEGGFASAELDRLRGLPFVVPVALGPLTLRAETAALAALACVQAATGYG
jgi:16S rRNA (uracil1498-N3)-methyltransferase